MKLRVNPRWLGGVAALVVLAAVSVGAFVLGRQTAPKHGGTWSQGYSTGYDEGVGVGRSLEVGDALSPTTKDLGTKAFQAGYRAGLVDSWGSYDGGWNIEQPYVVVIGKGVGDAPYRFDQRELLQPGVTYQLCASGTSVCQSG